MRQKILQFCKITGIGICCFLMIFWVALYDDANMGWSESVLFYAITYWVLWKYLPMNLLSLEAITCSVILGRLFFVIPVRIYDWSGSFPTLIFDIESVLAIVLASLCFKNKRPEIFFLTICVMILFNIFLLDAWFTAIRK